MNEKLKRWIAERNLEHLSEALLATAQAGLTLVKQPPRYDFLGTSRLGGLPDIGPDFIWPTYDGRALGFLAQINCAEVAPQDSERMLPEAGLLHFFYDLQEQPWGFDPKHEGGARVIYTPPGAWERGPAPDDLTAETILPAVSVGFHRILSIPSYGSTAGRSLGLTKGDWEAYFDLCETVRSEGAKGQPSHQLLGHSNNVQGDMQLECQLVSHGLYCGNPEGYKDPKRKLLESGAADWRLLFQFDSDDDLNIMWGDCGMVYFWIRDADLRQRDFTRTWTILQCS